MFTSSLIYWSLFIKEITGISHRAMPSPQAVATMKQDYHSARGQRGGSPTSNKESMLGVDSTHLMSHMTPLPQLYNRKTTWVWRDVRWHALCELETTCRPLLFILLLLLSISLIKKIWPLTFPSGQTVFLRYTFNWLA